MAATNIVVSGEGNEMTRGFTMYKDDDADAPPSAAVESESAKRLSLQHTAMLP